MENLDIISTVLRVLHENVKTIPIFVKTRIYLDEDCEKLYLKNNFNYIKNQYLLHHNYQINDENLTNEQKEIENYYLKQYKETYLYENPLDDDEFNLFNNYNENEPFTSNLSDSEDENIKVDQMEIENKNVDEIFSENVLNKSINLEKEDKKASINFILQEDYEKFFYYSSNETESEDENEDKICPNDSDELIINKILAYKKSYKQKLSYKDYYNKEKLPKKYLNIIKEFLNFDYQPEELNEEIIENSKLDEFPQINIEKFSLNNKNLNEDSNLVSNIEVSNDEIVNFFSKTSDISPDLSSTSLSKLEKHKLVFNYKINNIIRIIFNNTKFKSLNSNLNTNIKLKLFYYKKLITIINNNNIFSMYYNYLNSYKQFFKNFKKFLTYLIELFEEYSIKILRKSENLVQIIKHSGASVLALHGRTREMKGVNMGTACLRVIKLWRMKYGKDFILLCNGASSSSRKIIKNLKITRTYGTLLSEITLENPSFFRLLNKNHRNLILNYNFYYNKISKLFDFLIFDNKNLLHSENDIMYYNQFLEKNKTNIINEKINQYREKLYQIKKIYYQFLLIKQNISDNNNNFENINNFIHFDNFLECHTKFDSDNFKFIKKFNNEIENLKEEKFNIFRLIIDNIPLNLLDFDQSIDTIKLSQGNICFLNNFNYFP